MCFGGRDDKGDEPAPRPVDQQQQQRQQQGGHVKHAGGYDRNAMAGPSGQQPRQSHAAASGPPPQGQDQHQYSAPSGPPPSQRRHEYEHAPPAGPPPGQQRDDYAPPPGPPPASVEWAVPPPEPPPSRPGPEHDWQVAVPDTALFPEPPPFFSGHDRSHTTNASEDEANAGEEWCRQYPLARPLVLDGASQAALQAHDIRLMQPTGFNGKLNRLGTGHWEASTARGSPDRCIVGYPPLYVVSSHDPTRLDRPKTIYYEVKLLRGSREVSVAMGFTALPYPSFRMPGWHRGSLAVHGDDGHRFVNDRWGGKDFTAAFRRGETYGVGMTLRPTGTAHPKVDVFFTRNGAVAGGWDLHEETDAEEDLPVTGLEGFHDLSCAIGTFDGVSLEVILDPARWMYREAK
ncbi:SPRY domain-containing protein [Tolypocladium capitatum]|uniref:SPRY domain-containing protein n=1 Tax=Tolypocladium capitatum TaxID=45235 RepID=A0A2K3QNQ5_9HYPO|nr:SPRY domain-containing protein [Tolypocladium capitatum]